MIPNVPRPIETIPHTQLPNKDRRDLEMLHQEMIERTRKRHIPQYYHVGTPYGSRQAVFNVPYHGIPLFNICSVPPLTRKVGGYTKHHLIRLAQQYVVEGRPRRKPTKEEAITQLLKKGYAI